MNFSRAKSLLIFVFLLVDIFLLYMILVNSDSNPFIKNENYEKVVEILENNNIYIDDLSLLNQGKLYNLTAKNVAEERNEFLSSLLGDYKELEENIFISDKGEVNYSYLGEFIFYPASETKIKDTLNKNNVFNITSKLLKEMNFSQDFELFSVKEEKNVFKVVLNQSFYKKNLLNSYLTVYISQNGIEKIFGGIYEKYSIDSQNPDLKTKEEILIRFSALNKNKEKIIIKKIQEGYFNPKKDYVTFSLIPSIKITTDKGKNYFFDLTNGEILENQEFNLVNSKLPLF